MQCHYHRQQKRLDDTVRTRRLWVRRRWSLWTTAVARSCWSRSTKAFQASKAGARALYEALSRYQCGRRGRRSESWRRAPRHRSKHQRHNWARNRLPTPHRARSTTNQRRVFLLGHVSNGQQARRETRAGRRPSTSYNSHGMKASFLLIYMQLAYLRKKRAPACHRRSADKRTTCKC